MPTLTTVLWDLDGTLVDSGATWRGAEYAFLSSRGLPWDDASSERLIGGNINRMADVFEEVTGVRFSTEELRDELSAAVIAAMKERVPYMPGAVELGAVFAQRGIRQGIVTSSSSEIADTVASGLDWIDPALVVSLDDVRTPKPDPGPYLLAIARSADPEGILAIEDSPSGTASALAAGLRVLVASAANPGALPSGQAVHTETLLVAAGSGLDALLATLGLRLPD